MPNTATQTGKVKFFSTDKGFGFIIPDNLDEDLFFHTKQCKQKSYAEGDRIEFEIGKSNKGPCAVNVNKL